MKIRFRTPATCAAGALLALAAPLAAQEVPLQRIFTTRDFAASGYAPIWSPDGEGLTLVEADPQGGTDVWTEGISTGKRERLLQGSKVVSPLTNRPVEIEDVIWASNQKQALLYTDAQQVWRQRTKGIYYVYDREGARLIPLSPAEGWQQFAKFSPDGGRVGFVRNNDLFVTDLATGKETRLTHDGSDVIINGTFDWVYEEELDLRDGWRWSPDGKKIAFWRLDTRPEKVFHWVDNLAGQYSVPVGLRYPKPGEANAVPKIGVIDLETGQTTWMDAGGDSDTYLARMEWAASPNELVIQRLNRHQNRIDVMLADARTGRTRTLFSDTDPAWVDVDDDLNFVRAGSQLLWTSERDGYNQIYLYDRSGKVVRKLTPQPWDVTGINGIDAQNGWVYFTGTGGNPTERHLFRVRLDGKGLQRLSREPGTHAASVSPDGRFYVDIHSRAGVPPVTRLHRADGSVIRTLVDNQKVAANLAAAGAQRPEFFQVRAQDGTELNAWMIKPRDFDPGKRYPLLIYVYGTPGAQTVTDAWGGSRYLWYQHLAGQGYIVASVDARGTGGRGRAFEKAGYLRQGEVVSDDLLDAARHFASLPYVDADRIGMWGWSGGGYTTGLTVSRGGELFKAGISVAPVTDWRLYDTIYTERFMRTPKENPEGYERTSVLTHAPKMTANYLLIHGTADDNVHFQNAVQLAAALQKAGKQFDFMLYPNKNHAIPGAQTQLHLFTLMTEWLRENL
jgi:dipeptidyl-peptidase-4